MSISYFCINCILLSASFLGYSVNTDVCLILVFMFSLGIKGASVLYDFLMIKLLEIEREKIPN